MGPKLVCGKSSAWGGSLGVVPEDLEEHEATETWGLLGMRLGDGIRC